MFSEGLFLRSIKKHHELWVKKQKFCYRVLINVFNIISDKSRGSQCTYPCFPGVLFISTLHGILSKPLAAFPQNHSQNKGQCRERNESCHNDYHQSMVGILAEPGIEAATSCSQIVHATD